MNARLDPAVTVTDAVTLLSANRNTVKLHQRQLVRRGIWYRERDVVLGGGVG